MMRNDPWHYPRTELATHIVGGMYRNLLDRVSIFAHRKRGKTQFIKRDIIPLCREHGILPIYIDFWMDKRNPELCFIESVRLALSDNQSFLKKLQAKIGKMTFDALGQKLEVDINKTDEQNKLHSGLITVFHELNSLKTPVLLLLDEVQHLASRPEFDVFTAALRSFVVNREDSLVKCIFTGSSQEGLNQLFKDSKAPFYNSAQTQKFAELDMDFVQFELNTFAEVTGGKVLDADKALEILIKQNRAPARFVEMLRGMALNKVYDLEVGFKEFDNEIQESQTPFKAMYGQLRPIDIAILKLVATNESSGLYTPTGLNKVAAIMEVEPSDITKSAVQYSVKLLKQLEIIYSPARGKLAFENLDFKDYLLEI